MPTISATTRIIKLATAADIEALLRAMIGDDPLALRDHALLLSGWESGCGR